MVLHILSEQNSKFDPLFDTKCSRMSDKLKEAIIDMYGRGMTTRDISDQVKQIYGMEVTEGIVSNVTDRIVEHIKE